MRMFTYLFSFSALSSSLALSSCFCKSWHLSSRTSNSWLASLAVIHCVYAVPKLGPYSGGRTDAFT
ncbi:hypothetical protein BOTBODRAFT_473543 [Botryobasidium botryosum FD-172 SS1]|uniref:Secreted protein n=1 Tax=Botryobasidium botryosum (strain FD-172 SS1) TaxID=930990 RepID=A0A067M5G4_BOTB1|nr:hypothetical protein BOTBODRAFT_473543 [Botryobasidium botryosum FD-172 SS1]